MPIVTLMMAENVVNYGWLQIYKEELYGISISKRNVRKGT